MEGARTTRHAAWLRSSDKGPGFDRNSFHRGQKGILRGREGGFLEGRMGRMGRALTGSVDVRIARYGQKD